MCKQAVKKGNCDKRGPKANCKKTCGLCSTEASSTEAPDRGISNIITIQFMDMKQKLVK